MTTYYVDPGNTNVVAWQANHVYSEGDYACPTDLTTADAKSVYECTTGGTSHASTEPTWDETVDNTTSDGTVTWTARAPDSWEEALLSLQPAADLAVAGDIVYCRGTQNIAAVIDFDTNSGTTTSKIVFVGCNASGSEDGTLFVLDAQDAKSSCVLIASRRDIEFRNFEFKRATGSGFSATNSIFGRLLLVNCVSHDNGNHGFNSYYSGDGITFVLCRAYSNGGAGFYDDYYKKTQHFLCEAKDNGTYGIRAETVTAVGCLLHNNRSCNLYSDSDMHAVNCVIDGGNGDGVRTNEDSILIGCRITNHSAAGKKGIVVSTQRVRLLNCYFGNNTEDVTSGAYDVIPIDGSTTHVVFGGTDTDGTNGELLGGYKDIGNDDFNLKDTATLRSQAIELD